MNAKVWWLPGPLIGISLVLFSVIVHGGPGFFFWSLLAGGLFCFVVPIVQTLLLRSSLFVGRYAVASATAMGIAMFLSVLALFSGIFNFY